MRFILLGLLLLLATPGLCQKKQRIKLPPVPNSVQLSDSLFIDKTEIANIHWHEYLHALQSISDSAYRAALPDTAAWADDYPLGAVYVEHYFRYPGFHFFPVVGISYQQAQAYCQWRSEVVTRHHNEKLKKGRFRNSYVSFRFRLPTEREWMMAASGGSSPADDPYGVNTEAKVKLPSTQIIREQYALDSSTLSDEQLRADIARWYAENPVAARVNTLAKPYFFTRNGRNLALAESVYNNPPNRLGLYQMIGNVAEMVSQEGLAKGGSWFHLLEDSTIGTLIFYKKPGAWLGFRCVCELSIQPAEK